MSKKPANQSRAPRADPSDLAAALHTLASNLHHDDHHQSLAWWFRDLIESQWRYASIVEAKLNRGTDAQVARLLGGRCVADPGVLWPALPPDFVDRMHKACERRLACILEARRLIDGGAADGVQAASANHVTPTIIKATLGSVERLILGFLDALGRDGPLPRSTPDELAALSRVLRDHAHLACEAGGIDAGKAASATGTRREARVRWLAKAMLIVCAHPERSDAAIAREVGVHPSSLSGSRCPQFQAAARLARNPNAPRGTATNSDTGRSIEAVDDSHDPNRPASRQWADEEDADDRLDRDDNAQRAKRNAQRNARR